MPAPDLSHLSPTFLLPTRLTPAAHAALLAQLAAHNVPLTPTPSTASLFLADINTPTRCRFELRTRGIMTEPEPLLTAPLRVVKVAWFTECVKAGRVLPIEPWTVYTATVCAVVVTPGPSPERVRVKETVREKERKREREREKVQAEEEQRRGVMERARRDGVRNAEEDSRWRSERSEYKRSVYGTRVTDEIIKLSKSAGRGARPSTPEYEEERIKARGIDEMPEWVRRNVKLSCCRSTPADSPNADFIAHLHTIRDHRTLTSDEVGIRAYSTAIATLQAYPYPLISSSEIVLLPGCNVKIAALFHSWLSSHTDPKLRTVPDVEKLKLNENLVGLAMLHRIWGVGPETAREWWFVRGWRNVDDVVEYGWKGLTRVQQIGVKYYDDFQKPMMRWEAERIRDIITHHATLLLPGTTTILAGSYRRGSTSLTDADLLISHPDPTQLAPSFLERLVASLETEGCINYTLRLDRTAPPGRTLQTAMLVWQEQQYDDVRLRTLRLPGRNANVRRRVDLVVTRPETAGMALMRWTGGGTGEGFEDVVCGEGVEGWGGGRVGEGWGEGGWD
ncbi:uncharacterized protein LAJ45_05667 [Morchella importuna]|uniref:uncharacterized protein n=1 Tax=Morchella importuna TaxID=1174673 RepID=UPI001E8C9F79|nr:uncharacterized protein LAJ45_05667 [Morchella importuna]KAH8150454.1 hypothetical protein LAJ45_05667 [Morchella importuna]